jgi:[protein-PII] uridylyltransferase
MSQLEVLDLDLSNGTASQLDAFRSCVKGADAALVERYHRGEPVADLVSARADFVDQILERAWRQCLPENAPAALIAVGGYGRGELHPASDIDVLILTSDEPESLAEPLGTLVMLLWDIGLEIGHSVRNLAQCVAEAERDITVICNLIEARFLTGRVGLFEQMRSATASDRIWPSDAFFRAKRDEQRERYRKYGDTGYNLEPNIKESPGGLRDLQIIGWITKRHFGAEKLGDLVSLGFLTDSEYHQLIECRNHLWRIRFGLHVLTNRREDRLLFEHQRALALEFGYENTGSNLAVEQFMQRYYRTVMQLDRLNELLLQLFQEAILLKNELGAPEPINRRFQSRNGYLEAVNDGIFARYPLALLEVFLLLAQHPRLKGVRARTIRLIRAHRHLIDSRFRADIRSRSLFMEIMRQPQGVTKALRRMNRYGILARYIPAFGNIVGRMQYDLFHVFTVDEHTLRLIRNLRRFTVDQYAEEFPLAHRISATLPKPELLYLSGIFHDIAKGRGGDHSLLGAQDALAFCKLHDLPDWDSTLVAWLVEKHLLMSMTAQRRDIEDPEVIKTFAIEVGDTLHLDYLYLLTVADMRATNPSRWNSWKAALLRQLYESTMEALERGLEHPQEHDELIQAKQSEARRLLTEKGYDSATVTRIWMSLTLEYFLQSSADEIAWQTELVLENRGELEPILEIRPEAGRGCTEIFVCATDRDDLFAHSTALLDQLGLNVLEARIQTADNGCTMNSFFVLEENGGLVEVDYRLEEIETALRRGLAAPSSFNPKVSRRPHRHLRHFERPTQIEFHQDETHHRTVLRLRANDRPGLLSRVGQAFAECKVRVQNAKITTLGEIAEDSFLITDRHNRPIVDPAALDRLEESLHTHIDKDR